MERYVQIKDSGVDWIREIPNTWCVRALFQLVEQVKNKNKNLIERNLLSLSYGKIKRKDINNPEGLLPESFDGYNIIEANDIVLRLTDLQNDHTSLRVGQAKERGIITSAYITLRPANIVNPQFLYYVLHAYDLIKGFYGMGSGVRQGLNFDEVKAIRVPFPPVSEQSAIVDYLDDQISQIDSIIAEAKTSIEEYKQWKASIIFETVTKGLDANVEMRNSGTEFGSVPNNWQVIRLKNIACEIFKGNGITKEDIVEDGDTFCVRYGEIYSKYNFFFEHCLTKTNKNRVVAQRYFSYGDILFAGTGELVEEIGKGIVYIGNDVCLAGGDIIVVKHTQNPVFMAYALNSNYIQIQKSRNKAKLKVVHISSADIGSLIVFLPPIEEQTIIADYLKKKCSIIDSVIKEKEDLIGDLDQYKRSLIYEVVTGKRKVV